MDTQQMLDDLIWGKYESFFLTDSTLSICLYTSAVLSLETHTSQATTVDKLRPASILA